MLSQKMQDIINEQIHRELYSAYLYQAMSAHFEFESWGGFAHWMHHQAEEEQEHAERFYKYMLDRGARVILKGIEQPPVEFGSALEIFQAAYEHEQYITASINAIYELAVAEKDYPTQEMLQWFIKEQVEEEKHASENVAMLERIGDRIHALMALDRQLAERS
ncbi:MAG: ferritin [Anaerolineae bacterium]|jgi:ferritin|nr:ferritin [Anaerolineae bacterium]